MSTAAYSGPVSTIAIRSPLPAEDFLSVAGGVAMAAMTDRDEREFPLASRSDTQTMLYGFTYDLGD